MKRKQNMPSTPKDSAAGRQPASTSGTCAAPSEEERQRLIAIAAYYRAERRGFAPGAELDDWLAAEAEGHLGCQ